MQLDSITSQSLQIQADRHPPTFLINTSKALKGSKLKTKDFIRVQLMKFKHTSPLKYEQPGDQNHIPIAKNTQYRKFKPFGTIEDEEIHQIICHQRQKMSRETKGRIKLFENTKINSLCFDDNGHLPSATLEVRTKPATSHHTRTSKQRPFHNKIISQHFHKTISFERKPKTAQLIFRTQNLGLKMNNMLNIYLNQQKKTERKQHEQSQQCKTFEGQNGLFVANNLPIRKKNNVTFMRQLKKHRKIKMEEKTLQPLNTFNSQQITPHLTAEMTHRQRTVKLQSRKHKLLNNYSIQLRRRGNTADVKTSVAKSGYQQNDNI